MRKKGWKGWRWDLSHFLLVCNCFLWSYKRNGLPLHPFFSRIEWRRWRMESCILVSLSGVSFCLSVSSNSSHHFSLHPILRCWRHSILQSSSLQRRESSWHNKVMNKEQREMEDEDEQQKRDPMRVGSERKERISVYVLSTFCLCSFYVVQLTSFTKSATSREERVTRIEKWVLLYGMRFVKNGERIVILFLFSLG